MSVSILHPKRLALYVVLSGLDLFLTYKLFKVGGGHVYESNPIADAWLKSYGWFGMTLFKLMSMLVVGGVAVYISVHRPRMGSGLLTFACISVAGVVLYSLTLVQYFGKSFAGDRHFALVESERPWKELDSPKRMKGTAHWVAGPRMHRMLPVPGSGRAQARGMEGGPVAPSLPDGARGQQLPFNQMPNLLYGLPEQESQAAEAGK
jgi:Domain of unknown function (DUF5658)